jgi:hypothetical protein
MLPVVVFVNLLPGYFIFNYHKTYIYIYMFCHLHGWLQTGFGLTVGFTEHLQNVATKRGAWFHCSAHFGNHRITPNDFSSLLCLYDTSDIYL